MIQGRESTVLESYRQYSTKIKKRVSCTFISPIYNFSWRETKMFTRQVKAQIGKSTLFISTSMSNADSGGKRTTFPSISSIIGRAFSIFRQKMDGPNPSEKDIKVSIPAPTSCLQSWYY